jgi:hypothetical protein
MGSPKKNNEETANGVSVEKNVANKATKGSVHPYIVGGNVSFGFYIWTLDNYFSMNVVESDIDKVRFLITVSAMLAKRYTARVCQETLLNIRTIRLLSAVRSCSWASQMKWWKPSGSTRLIKRKMMACMLIR